MLFGFPGMKMSFQRQCLVIAEKSDYLPFPVNIHAGTCSQFPLGKARRRTILSIFCYVTGFFLKAPVLLCSRYSEPVNWFRLGIG